MMYLNGHKPRGYKAIHALKKQVKIPVKHLIVLGRGNDPFVCGSPAQERDARWFADLFDQLGYTAGVHLRRVHYELASGEKVYLKPDGMPYENTEECWSFLTLAGKHARYLGMVDAHLFVDRRNAKPEINFDYIEPEEQRAVLDWYEVNNLRLPSITVDLGADLDLEFPGLDVYGYDYHASAQPYLLELWIEKTTMNDVLEPICEEWGVNLATSAGFQSVSNVVHLLRRAEKIGKPLRVLYISDFDPAGDQMPVQVARHLEYWVDQYAPGADVKLQPIALTVEQVQQYNLPPKPIKESDLRRANFKERYGVAGATELDALEAIYPGELARIVTDAITPYRDDRLKRKYSEAASDARAEIADQWKRYTEPIATELAEIDHEAAQILAQYNDELAALADRLQAELAPLDERLETVRRDIQNAKDYFEPEFPDLPEPAAPGQDEGGWLFDAGRTYLEQLDVFQQRKNGQL